MNGAKKRGGHADRLFNQFIVKLSFAPSPLTGR